MHSDMTPLPVRGSDTAEIIKNDHQTIKGLLSALTKATGRSERMQTLDQLKAALTIHNATEENLLYPALAKVAGHNTESQKLYHETAEADMLVFELDTMLKEGDDSHFESKAKKLQGAIEEHVESEESKALKHLQEKAEPKEAKMLTESIREFRSSFKYETPATRSATTGEIPASSKTTPLR